MWRTKHQGTLPLNKKWIKLQWTEKKENRVSIAGNSGRTKGDQENAQLSESSVRDAEKGTISQIIVKSNKKLKGPSQPHLCFCLHTRVWLLYFMWSMSKRNKITVKLLKIIKHTFRNTTYSKTFRFRITTLQYQSFQWHRKWRRLTRAL